MTNDDVDGDDALIVQDPSSTGGWCAPHVLNYDSDIFIPFHRASIYAARPIQRSVWYKFAVYFGLRKADPVILNIPTRLERPTREIPMILDLPTVVASRQSVDPNHWTSWPSWPEDRKLQVDFHDAETIALPRAVRDDVDE